MNKDDITAPAECGNCELPVLLSERQPEEHETTESEVVCACPECGATICKAWTSTEIAVLMIH